MGQGLLTSRGGSGGSGGVDWTISPDFIGWEYKSEIITNNKEWMVPRAKDSKIEVRIFGGSRHGILQNVVLLNTWDDIVYNWTELQNGKSGSKYFSIKNHNVSYCNINAYGGGGGGYMCNMTLTNLKFGNLININIGEGGAINSNGGPTTFGNIMTANGGSTGNIVENGITGGDGGSGGGAVFIGNASQAKGGDAQYGGGGTYGGNGGGWNTYGENGTNTKSIEFNYNGNGNHGYSSVKTGMIDEYTEEKYAESQRWDNYSHYYCTGIYQSNDTINDIVNNYYLNIGVSGGGGYGGNGGYGNKGASFNLGNDFRLDTYNNSDFRLDDNRYDVARSNIRLMFAFDWVGQNSEVFMGGGGGGFGSGNDGNAMANNRYESGIIFIGGGGGGYKSSWAYGGTTTYPITRSGNGGNGVCIINYIAPVFK